LNIFFVDEETISRWAQSYQEKSLDGLKDAHRRLRVIYFPAYTQEDVSLHYCMRQKKN